jgi:hypothetical protein
MQPNVAEQKKRKAAHNSRHEEARRDTPRVFDPLAMQRPPRPQFPTSNCSPPATASTRSRARAIPASVGQRGSGLLEGVEKRFCSFYVDRVEPFGESVVDRLEKRHGLGGTALIA